MSQLQLEIIGDSGPFSRLGKSIGYQITHEEANYLLDCGAPVFQMLGESGLENLNGIIGTHAHEDHKRWFTDIALYQKFSMETEKKLKLIGTHEIIRQYRYASPAALERTLNHRSDDLRSLRFEDYVEAEYLGPEPKYKIKQIPEGNGQFKWRVVDQFGNSLPPDRAKVVKPPDTIIPSMIVKDPVEEVWVEPLSFYTLNDDRFYRTDGTISSYQLSDDLSFKPYKAPAWHGPPTTAYIITCPEGEIYFSSDTVYNPELWEKLPRERESKLTGNEQGRSFIEDRVENLTEKIWSQQRLERAKSIYERDSVFIHDVSGANAQVHTAYEHLEDLNNQILLTHSPDEFVTTHPLAHLEKTFVLRDNQLMEKTEDGEIFPLDAHCYLKEYSEYFVGYEDPEGDFKLVRNGPGIYDVQLKPRDSERDSENSTTISLYRDIGGRYFPVESDENKDYRVRTDGRVEKIQVREDGSEARLISDCRSELSGEPG